jgi:hypothetical protein
MTAHPMLPCLMVCAYGGFCYLVGVWMGRAAGREESGP